jgi:hypothetical protein
VSLLAQVHEILERERIAHAVIGAAAMAVHGVVRSTLDLDLLTVDPAVLERRLWVELARQGARVDVRHGDADDPLAGVVRLEAEGERDVDLVVGRDGWQQAIVLRASVARVGGVELGVATVADLVLLKLYAAGPQDRWDIQQLLTLGDRPELEQTVGDLLLGLPEASQRLWQELTAR